jgi:hypothetical protein
MLAVSDILTRGSRRASKARTAPWAGLAAALLLCQMGAGCTAARNMKVDGGEETGGTSGAGGHGGAGGHSGAGGHGGVGKQDGGVSPDAKTSHDGGTDSGPTSCGPGSHNCAGMGCVSDDSTAHCGNACGACSAPDGGAPFCAADAGACDFTCGPSLKKCNGHCVSGCCIDSDCPDQSGKKGQCDTSTNSCSYQNCTSGYKPCGTTCIPSANCCVASDCTGTCTTCSAAGSCVAVKNAADPVASRCPGTCDATGICKSKQGQPCNTVPGTTGGCLVGLACSPDNYCCNRACTGSCEACDVAGAAGTCTTVADIPHVGHTTCAGSATACNGSCAGSTNGQCVWPAGSCGQTSCSNLSGSSGTTYMGVGTCNTGTCGAGATSSCSGSLLCASATTCKTGCSVDADCITGDYCNAGLCVLKGTSGAFCSTANQCSTGFCIDGLCCENSCPGLCMACATAKTGNLNGLCRAVKTGTDPDNECDVDSANACGQDGTCDGAGACRLQGSGISCGSSSCSGSTFTAAGKCNGTGTCIPASGSSACSGNFTCASSGTACGTTCSANSTGGCTLGNECLNGACIQATVPCGPGSCAVANGGGGCCATDPSNTGTNAVLTCLPAGATCTTLSNIICNGKSDCPTGQYCCIAGNGCNPSHWSNYCTTNVSACVGSPQSFGYQVCDPSGGGSECVAGSCQSYSTCVPGIFVCH